MVEINIMIFIKLLNKLDHNARLRTKYANRRLMQQNWCNGNALYQKNKQTESELKFAAWNHSFGHQKTTTQN